MKRQCRLFMTVVALIALVVHGHLRCENLESPTELRTASFELAETDRDAALFCLRKAVSLSPNDPFLSAQLGDMLVQRAEFTDAIPHLRVALDGFEAATVADPPRKSDPRWMDMFSNLHYLLAQALHRTGDLDLALPQAVSTLQKNPKNLGAANMLGILLLHRGDTASAVRAYRRALRIAPDCAPCQVNLAAALESLGNRSDALAIYQRLLERHGSAVTDAAAAPAPVDVVESVSLAFVRCTELLTQTGRVREAATFAQQALSSWFVVQHPIGVPVFFLTSAGGWARRRPRCTTRSATRSIRSATRLWSRRCALPTPRLCVPTPPPRPPLPTTPARCG
jgi:tetratricopeptide (TPR) repeat protein